LYCACYDEDKGVCMWYCVLGMEPFKEMHLILQKQLVN
jgi:hypothetical protein